MNHLRKFEDWKEVFKRARTALNPGGVFIFDVNTVYGLEQYVERGAFAEFPKTGIAIFEATALGDNRFRLDLRFLKKRPNGSFQLHQTSIPELTVPTGKIRSAAEKVFGRVAVTDTERARPSAKSEELYFICQA